MVTAKQVTSLAACGAAAPQPIGTRPWLAARTLAAFTAAARWGKEIWMEAVE
jgi:hypothetical protein